jgi:hypothetical protein
MAPVKHIPKKLSSALQEETLRFFETHPPAVVSKNLRRILIDYLYRELEIGVPIHLPASLWQLYDLFELLDAAEKETQGWHPVESLSG